MNTECQCDLCIEHKQFASIISRLSLQEDIAWMQEFYNQVDCERLEANVNEAILDGSWPSAVQYLNEGLRLHKEKYEIPC